MASRSIPGQKGATLVEVLIAILILSIGMLGMAGLMATATKYQTGAWARAGVSGAIADLSDRIRANLTGANGYQSAPGGVATTGTGYQLSLPYSTQAAASSVTVANCLTASCTPADRATHDVATWRNLLRTTLPGGAGLISGDVTTGFRVTVMWFDKDMVKSDDSLYVDTATSSPPCTGSETGTSARLCCPTAAAAPPGTRCYNALVLP
jgi:type IV pilus assembly protein PilV